MGGWWDIVKGALCAGLEGLGECYYRELYVIFMGYWYLFVAASQRILIFGTCAGDFNNTTTGYYLLNPWRDGGW